MSYVIVEVHTDHIHGLSVRTFDAGNDAHLAEMARRAHHMDIVLDRPWIDPVRTFVCRVEAAS